MILYLTKKYVTISLTLAGILIVFFSIGGVKEVYIKSFIWSGIVSVYIINRFFEWRNIWVLYYNLGLPKYVLLGLNFLIFEVTLITAFILISRLRF